MPLTAQEQYLLELINRGRLDPAAEAARYGIDLNASLNAGTISTAAKQVLAPNALLERAAIGHSQWMLEADVFDHVGQNGSTLGSRASSAGYLWYTLGENIAVWGTSGAVDMTSAIENHHRGLFLSAGHRTNLMSNAFSEVGLAQEQGLFTFSNGFEANSSMLTELFGAQSGVRFLTGVAYTDRNNDRFYSIGEGTGNTVFTVAGRSDTTEAAGGYSVGVNSSGLAAVTGRAGTTNFSVTVDFSIGNVKLDVVNGTMFYTSGSLTLGSGIANVTQLGVGNIHATGNAASNTLIGNAGTNVLSGAGGNDRLLGFAGKDRLLGGVGNDVVNGGHGNDTLSGNDGADMLTGSIGSDVLNGGLGADRFIFGNGHGADVVQDFRLVQQDRLQLNDDLWTGTLSASQVVSRFASVTSAGVVFDFGGGDRVTLQGVTTTDGMAGALLIY
ncbi:MAG: CAP domain-containing protein [Paracoccaceae bacterium]